MRENSKDAQLAAVAREKTFAQWVARLGDGKEEADDSMVHILAQSHG